MPKCIGANKVTLRMSRRESLSGNHRSVLIMRKTKIGLSNHLLLRLVDGKLDNFDGLMSDGRIPIKRCYLKVTNLQKQPFIINKYLKTELLKKCNSPKNKRKGVCEEALQ